MHEIYSKNYTNISSRVKPNLPNNDCILSHSWEEIGFGGDMEFYWWKCKTCGFLLLSHTSHNNPIFVICNHNGNPLPYLETCETLIMKQALE